MFKWIKNFISMTGTGYYYEPEPGFINEVLNRETLHNTFTKLISVDDLNNDMTLIYLKFPVKALIHNDSYIDCNYHRYIIYYHGEYYIIEDILTRLFCWPRQQFKMWISKIPSIPIKNNTGRDFIYISEIHNNTRNIVYHSGVDHSDGDYSVHVLNTTSSKIFYSADDNIYINAENYELISYNTYFYSDGFIRSGIYKEGESFIINGDEYKITPQSSLQYLRLIIDQPYNLYKFGDIYAIIINDIWIEQLYRVNRHTKPALH
jgi:hypothetical protein